MTKADWYRVLEAGLNTDPNSPGRVGNLWHEEFAGCRLDERLVFADWLADRDLDEESEFQRVLHWAGAVVTRTNSKSLWDWYDHSFWVACPEDRLYRDYLDVGTLGLRGQSWGSLQEAEEETFRAWRRLGPEERKRVFLQGQGV
jgi:hypothetical protein